MLTATELGAEPPSAKLQSLAMRRAEISVPQAALVLSASIAHDEARLPGIKTP
jgi:hypothetical protein